MPRKYGNRPSYFLICGGGAGGVYVIDYSYGFYCLGFLGAGDGYDSTFLVATCTATDYNASDVSK